MGQINSLSEETISQISAGEVVERPSHLVKELVENSLDAQATEIEIDFHQGGRFVKVKDNGCGIPPEQMPLALLRHSTSKIKSSLDLWHLNTYGFRGEALASIASVSDLSLISGVKGTSSVFCLRQLFGKTTEKQQLSGSCGTTVIVRSLFENTPARFKFLKSEGAEHSAIKNSLKALALANPHISWRILQKSRLLFYWPAKKNLIQRVEQILLAKDLYKAEGKNGAYQLTAVIGAPNNTVRNRRSSWFFVQNRWVESPVMQASLMAAYRGLLMHGEYPLAIIQLKGPCEEIDVNVHPSKSQIRFKDSSLVFKLIESSLRQKLEQAPWTKNITQSRFKTKEQNLPFKARFFNKTQFPIKQKEYSKTVLSSLAWPKSEGPNNPDIAKQSSPNNPAIAGHSALNPDLASKQTSISHPDSINNVDTYPFTAQQNVADNPPTGPQPDNRVNPLTLGHQPSCNPAKASGQAFSQNSHKKTFLEKSCWSSLQVLAQAHLTYLVCQSDKALVFIDQHAAHERILYERFFYSWKNGGPEIQNQLLPFPLDLEEGQATALLELDKELQKLGVCLEPLGPHSLAVRSSPLILKEKALKEALLFLAKQRLETGDSFALEKSVRDFCATLACHSAIRAGKSLSLEDMNQLLSQMDEFPLSSFCPHGRPVFVDYPISRLERDFGRLV